MGLGHDHGAGGGHGDHHHGRAADRRRLAWTLGLVLLYTGAEVVGGLLTGSLALLSDAGHMVSDAGSLALALFALWIAGKPRTPERTYGYHRTEILAALVNGVTLVAIAVFVVLEAWERFQDPPEVQAGGMIAVATGGLVINLVCMWILHGGRDDGKRSLNMRGAWLHVVSDMLGSVQAVIAGLLIWRFGWAWADPAAAVVIALLVVWSSWSLLKESVHVLMEATPGHIDSREVGAALVAVDGVSDVHDLHIWTITSGFDALSVHARVEGDRPRGAVLEELRELLRQRFSIHHSTIQLEEGQGCGCEDGACD